MKTLLTGNAASPPQSNLPQSNKEWQAWGERDPLYGVIPQPGRERDGATPWTDEEFYQTGRNDWEELLQRWRRYGVERESCVEIGCGAGRLTRHIAQDFAEVHGLDVAAGMIDYARQHVPANVHLHVTNGTSLPVPDHSVTAVFSVIVFLHFDRIEYAAAYFREMARALKPGGTIVYSTCSLEVEENSHVIKQFLSANPEFGLVSEKQLLPFADQMDGAYVALLKRMGKRS